jgi:hypothetical protein
MRTQLQIFASFFVLWAASAAAVPKPHVISFGKWAPAKWYVGSADNKALDLKIRALYVDTRLKEFTTGPAHDVTDRLFVVRRMFPPERQLAGCDQCLAAMAVATG